MNEMPYPQADSSEKKLPLVPILLGVGGCLVILCIGLVLVGGIFFYQKYYAQKPAAPTEISQPTRASAPTRPSQPTRAPEATQPAQPTRTVLEPTLAPHSTQAVQPTEASLPDLVWSADPGQELTANTLRENFSSNKYEWADVSDEVNTWGIEDEHYFLHLLKNDWSAWAYMPADFIPTVFTFDAAVVPGYETGGYGLICNYVDEDNYHFVIFDPFYKEYSIGYRDEGEFKNLLDDDWVKSENFKESPYAVNTINILCDDKFITVIINEAMEDFVMVETGEKGKAGFYGNTYEDAPATGFKVLFDNVTISNP